MQSIPRKEQNEPTPQLTAFTHHHIVGEKWRHSNIRFWSKWL